MLDLTFTILSAIIKLNYLIPKHNQIMFKSDPDFSDNPKALWDYIVSKEKKR